MTTIKIEVASYKEIGGGFFPEDTPHNEGKTEMVAVLKPPPIVKFDRPSCRKCDKTFATSWLFENFDYRCCDECKNPEEHMLVPKTEAINTYLLKYFDLDKREPPLKCIKRKNPHNIRWGEMKLYLQIQVEKRALEVWGSKERIEEEKKKREKRKALARTKKYNKQLKELRMSMRSSLYNSTSVSSHTHEFEAETYNEQDDTYTHKCLTCTYEETFEKI